MWLGDAKLYLLAVCHAHRKSVFLLSGSRHFVVGHPSAAFIRY